MFRRRVIRMDVTEENMSPQEMLERIAELDYSQSQLKELNDEMRKWLDSADEDMAALRSENTMLRKQVKDLEKVISEAEEIEAEPCRSFVDGDLNVNTCSEKKTDTLEKEFSMLKEQNKKLSVELRSLQEEKEQDKISLSKLRDALQSSEMGMEEAQIRLQHKDEVIYQNKLQLKHLEETVEECSTIIKDLRLTSQDLRKQLEDRLDETSFASLNDVTREGSLSPPLSFAEEIKLLVSSAEVKTSMAEPTDLGHEETEHEETLKPLMVTVDPQTKKCADTLKRAIMRAGLLMLCVLSLTVLAIVSSGSCAGRSDFFSFKNLWSIFYQMFQPYCRVQYGALPPI